MGEIVFSALSVGVNPITEVTHVVFVVLKD